MGPCAYPWVNHCSQGNGIGCRYNCGYKFMSMPIFQGDGAQLWLDYQRPIQRGGYSVILLDIEPDWTAFLKPRLHICTVFLNAFNISCRICFLAAFFYQVMVDLLGLSEIVNTDQNLVYIISLGSRCYDPFSLPRKPYVWGHSRSCSQLCHRR